MKHQNIILELEAMFPPYSLWKYKIRILIHFDCSQENKSNVYL